MIAVGMGAATAQGTLAELRARSVPLAPQGRARGMSPTRPHFAALGVPDRAMGIRRFRALAEIALAESGVSADVPLVLATCNGGASELDLADWHESFEPEALLGRRTSAVVSGSCASGLHALWVAKALLDTGAQEVAIVAVDILSPANESTFSSLRVLADRLEEPLSPQRSGFLLGEAAVAVRIAKRGDGVELCLPLLGRDDWSAFADAAARAAGPLAGGLVQGGGPAVADREEIDFATRCGLQPARPLADYFGHTMGASSLLAAVLSALPAPPTWIASAAPVGVLSRALGGQLAALVPGARQPAAAWGQKRAGGPLFSPLLRALLDPAEPRPDTPPAALIAVLDRPLEPPQRARVGGRLIPSAAVEITPGHASLTAARGWGYLGPTVTLVGAAEAALDALATRFRHSGGLAIWRLEAACGARLEVRAKLPGFARG